MMYKEPIFLAPVFQERIWGGQKLHRKYGYHLPYEKTGEAWVISAHSSGPSKIQNGPLAGKTLQDAWEKHGELFNKAAGNKEAFPLLVKVLDANDDLSVQVHPDDTFASEIEQVPYGKTECWYVLEAEPEAKIILGHHAQTKEEFHQMVEAGQWDELLQTKQVKAGDFIYVPSGTIHAIGKGVMILEIQQSSDITYRVYDYDRKDDQGNLRALHLDRAKQVTTIPHVSAATEKETTVIQDLTSEKLIEENYFTVYHWQLKGEAALALTEDFLQISVINGTGIIEIDEKSFPFEKGTHFIIPSGIKEYKLSGDAEMIVSHR